MKIEFIREIRDCPFNERQNNPRLLLADFAVVIDGERRATWQRVGNEYWLHDENHERILQVPSRPENAVYAPVTKANQKDFARVIEEYLALGKIPTMEQYANRKRAREEEERLEREQRSIEATARRKREAAEELYAAARAITVLCVRKDGAIVIGPRGWEMLQAAIKLADEGAVEVEIPVEGDDE